MKKLTIAAFAFICLGMLLNSCKKDEKPIVIEEEDVTSMVETMAAFNTDAFDQRVIPGFKTGQRCACPDIIYHQNEEGGLYPINLTFDFGEEDCEFINGVFIRGMIHFSLTDNWFNQGAQKSLQFEDYFVNEVNIFGTKTSTNTGPNDQQLPTWQTDIANAGIIDTLGNEKTWNATLYGEMVYADFKSTKCHFTYQITGNGQGTDNGIPYSAEITSPLVYNFGCWYPVRGEITITAGTQTILVNYGDGNCDDKATMQIGDADPVEITIGLFN